ALEIAGEPARQHVGAASRVEIVERVHAAMHLEQRDLPPGHERPDPGAFYQVLERADVVPAFAGHAATSSADLASADLEAFSCGVAGRICPRSSTNTTLRSASSEFTKVRNRLSVTGSSIATFHSQA